uniref:NAD-dependent epimerase/dehydratase family protein n=1 Tax=Algoriphagus sp. TaxID=1872435 RepID=UPI004048DD8D
MEIGIESYCEDFFILYSIMIKIIVTGGSGFIGTNLIHYFIEKGFDVINIDITPPVSEFIKYWRLVDINDYEKLYRLILEFSPEYVIHLAARTDLRGKNSNDYNVNTIGTQNLISALNKTPSIKRVLFASSMLVCRPGYFPAHDTDYSPSTLYGKSKVEMEKIIRNTNQNYDWVIVRPTSIWGPYFKEPYFNFFELIRNKKYFHIGYLSCSKTYGYVGNVIYQLEEILFTERSQSFTKTFYLGDYEPIHIEFWANEIANEFGYSIRRVPFFIVWSASLFGDVLKSFNIEFPLNSFRLKNMTTDNIINLSDTFKIAPNLPFTRKEGIINTLNWLIKRK